MVLDVGCGPALYRNCCNAEYIGLDITLAPYAGKWPRDVDIVASGQAIPFADETFDLLMCKSTLYLFPDASEALNEFYRVLKTRGRTLLVDYNRRTQKRLAIAEGAVRPCWSQWRLKELVKNAGFRECELLSSAARNVAAPEKWVRLVLQEWTGTWAIVIGVK